MKLIQLHGLYEDEILSFVSFDYPLSNVMQGENRNEVLMGGCELTIPFPIPILLWISPYRTLSY